MPAAVYEEVDTGASEDAVEHSNIFAGNRTSARNLPASSGINYQAELAPRKHLATVANVGPKCAPKAMKEGLRIALVAFAAFCATARLATAEPASAPTQSVEIAAAKEHYARGQHFVEKKEYLHALAEFSAGYELTARPAFLFNMAECARLLGDKPKARSLYQRYLDEAPEGALVVDARRRLEELSLVKPMGILVVKDSGAPKPGVTNLESSTKPTAPQAKPIWSKWPFWAAVGAVVVTGTVVGVVVTNKSDSCGPMCTSIEL